MSGRHREGKGIMNSRAYSDQMHYEHMRDFAMIIVKILYTPWG